MGTYGNVSCAFLSCFILIFITSVPCLGGTTISPGMAGLTPQSTTITALAAVYIHLAINTAQVSGIEVKIAAILPEDSRRLFSTKRVAPAIEYAIEYLHNKTELLKGHTVKVSYRDSKCSSAHGMNHAINYYVEDNVDVFFGPVCDFSVAPVARQAMFWNIPLISVGAMARDFTEYRQEEYLLLVRVGPVNFDSLSMFIKKLLYENAWNSYKIIYEKEGQSEYMDGFCHLAASSVHYDIGTMDSNIHQDYFKLDGDIEGMLRNEIGKKFGDTTYPGSNYIVGSANQECIPEFTFQVADAVKVALLA